jgi:hypothetical protein
MDSAFGIDHGDVSKGLPRAVQNGQGKMLGSLMRIKNSAGKSAAKLNASPAYSDQHASSLKYLKDSEIKRGKQAKEAVEDVKFDEHMKHGYKTRGIRARLLNDTGETRRNGYKSLAANSGVHNGFRGRVGNKMKELP